MTQIVVVKLRPELSSTTHLALVSVFLDVVCHANTCSLLFLTAEISVIRFTAKFSYFVDAIRPCLWFSDSHSNLDNKD
jgi:hypothetical protein